MSFPLNNKYALDIQVIINVIVKKNPHENLMVCFIAYVFP